jgi:hypothetical protein
MSGRLHPSCVIVTFAIAVLLGAGEASAAAQNQPGRSSGPLEAFVARVEAYARLHQRLEAPLPAFESTTDPLSRLVNRRYLASAIRAARRHARQGDIFTPDVVDMFRAQLAEVMRGRDVAKIIGPLDDESWTVDTPVVNEPFRAELSRAVPSLVLQALPPLPGGIEYRITGTNLVLWDVHADIVIDILPCAFCPASHA